MVLGFRKALEACDLWLLREEETTEYNREYFGSTWDHVFHEWREEQAAAKAAELEENRRESRADAPTPTGSSEDSLVVDGSMSSLDGIVVVSNPRVGAEGAPAVGDQTPVAEPTENPAAANGAAPHTSQVAPEPKRSKGGRAKDTISKSSSQPLPEVVSVSTKGDTKKGLSKQGSVNESKAMKAWEKDGELKVTEEEEKKEEEVEKPQPPLLRTLIRVYGPVMLIAQLSMLVYVFVLFINPCLLWCVAKRNHFYIDF